MAIKETQVDTADFAAKLFLSEDYQAVRAASNETHKAMADLQKELSAKYESAPAAKQAPNVRKIGNKDILLEPAETEKYDKAKSDIIEKDLAMKDFLNKKFADAKLSSVQASMVLGVLHSKNNADKAEAEKPKSDVKPMLYDVDPNAKLQPLTAHAAAHVAAAKTQRT